MSWFEGINENHENWCSTNKNEFSLWTEKKISKLAIIFELFIMIVCNI